MSSSKNVKIAYWISTGLLSILMVMSATMYFVKYDDVAETFTSLGFPLFIIYPLGVAKYLGVVAILTRKSQMLKESAYAGFFFDMLLALSAHINVGDQMAAPAGVGIVFLFVSYFTEKKL